MPDSPDNTNPDHSPNDGGTVQVSIEDREQGRIAHLLIDHRRRRNAIGPAVIAALLSEAEALARDPDLRAVTLRGAGTTFAAGANVKVMAELDPPGARAFITSLHLAIHAVRTLPVPVIAVLQGHCYGAAMELAAACDMRIADETLVAGMPEVRVGLPSVIEACLLPRLIGWGACAELLLTGRDIDADEARALGFVQRLTEAPDLGAGLEDWLTAILASGPNAVRTQKAVMQQWEPDTRRSIVASIDAFAASYRTGEPQEMLAKALTR